MFVTYRLQNRHISIYLYGGHMLEIIGLISLGLAGTAFALMMGQHLTHHA
jgi:hypothetical protein